MEVLVKDALRLLYVKLAAAAERGDLDAVETYSQAIQRITVR